MRVLPLLLITLSLALAGCSKAPPPTTDGNSTTSTSTGPTGSTTSTAPTTPTTPTPKAPNVVKSGTTDFTQNTPAQPLAAIPITIDAGYSLVTLNVTFSCASGVPACVAANTVTVKAAGQTCSVPDGPVQASAPVKCAKSGPAAEGASKVEFSGNGLISAVWSVIES